MNTNNKIRPMWLITISSIILAALVFSLVWFSFNRLTNNTVIAKMGENDITYGEFEIFLQEARADTLTYINEKYNYPEVNNDFWIRNFGNGETPANYLKQKVLDDLLEYKAYLIVLKNNGFIDDISYKATQKAYKAENARRKSAISRGEPVYGPEELTLPQFCDDRYEKTMLELKTKLLQELKPSDLDILEIYESNKKNDPALRKSNSYVVSKVYIDYSKSSTKEEAEKIANEISNNFEIGIEKYKDKIEVKNETLTRATRDEEDKAMISNYDIAGELEVGKTSLPYDMRDYIAVMKCLEIKPGEYVSVYEAKDYLEQIFVKRHISNLLDEVKKNMPIVKTKAFSKIGNVFN